MTRGIRPNMTFRVPEEAKVLGSVPDPFTGEICDVYAVAKTPGIEYKKSNGEFSDLTTSGAREDWPQQGLWDLYLSNGKLFSQVNLDPRGWWCSVDTVYTPVARKNRGRFGMFFVQLGAGLSNGYPRWDVFMYSLRSAFIGKRWWRI